MKVLFSINGASDRCTAVYWEGPTGVNERYIDSDGKAVDRVWPYSLSFILDKFGSSHKEFWPSEVSDVRAAFKYLGKNSDLVRLLPEVLPDA